MGDLVAFPETKSVARMLHQGRNSRWYSNQQLHITLHHLPHITSKFLVAPEVVLQPHHLRITPHHRFSNQWYNNLLFITNKFLVALEAVQFHLLRITLHHLFSNQWLRNQQRHITRQRLPQRNRFIPQLHPFIPHQLRPFTPLLHPLTSRHRFSRQFHLNQHYRHLLHLRNHRESIFVFTRLILFILSF